MVGVGTATGMHYFAEHFLHVARHLHFVIGPLPMETQNGNSPLVHHGGINLAVAVFVGDHLPTSSKADAGAISAPALLLQGGTVSFKVIANIVKVGHARHIATAAKLDVVAAKVVVLAVELPPRNVHVHSAHTIVVVRRNFLQLREISRAGAANRVCQVATDHA